MPSRFLHGWLTTGWTDEENWQKLTLRIIERSAHNACTVVKRANQADIFTYNKQEWYNPLNDLYAAPTHCMEQSWMQSFTEADKVRVYESVKPMKSHILLQNQPLKAFQPAAKYWYYATPFQPTMLCQDVASPIIITSFWNVHQFPSPKLVLHVWHWSHIRPACTWSIS